MDDRPADPTPDDVKLPDLHPDQLRPATYPPYNHVMHGPRGRDDVGSIWSSIGPDEKGYAVTSIPFDLTDRQKAMVEAGGHVQVNIWQAPMPPINVCIEGPFCECHDAEMVFDEHDGGFRCAAQREAGDDSTDPLEAARRDFSPADSSSRDDRTDGPGDGEGRGPAAPDDSLGR